MNMSHDILLVEDSQNDIDLALYALREADWQTAFSSPETAKKL
jgi:hypothetical protein